MRNELIIPKFFIISHNAFNAPRTLDSIYWNFTVAFVWLNLSVWPYLSKHISLTSVGRITIIAPNAIPNNTLEMYKQYTFSAQIMANGLS